VSKLIAVAVDENENVWKGHFGISPSFMLFDDKGNLVASRENPYSPRRGEQHKSHDDPKLIVSLLNDCSIFIAKRMGDKSKKNLAGKMNITAFITEKENPLQAVKEFLENRGKQR